MFLKPSDVFYNWSLKGKVTVIVPTFSASINCLLLNIFSLLVRSKPKDVLEHICVCINGPDSRTGDTSLQDKKQQFLEELRLLKWGEHAMPLTVLRVWSRVGYAEAVEMATPWIHTEAYVLTHDDMIVLNNNWENELKSKFFTESEVAIASIEPLVEVKLSSCNYRTGTLIRLPSLSTVFTVCKKGYVLNTGGFWQPLQLLNEPFAFSVTKEVVNLCGKEDNLAQLPVEYPDSAEFIQQGIGSWVYRRLKDSGYKSCQLNPCNFLHLEGMTYVKNSGTKALTWLEHKTQVELLEAEIKQWPEYWTLYNKYKNDEKIYLLDFLAIKYGTDKSSINHCYAPRYDDWFYSVKHTAKHVLEIGVDWGSSLKMWKEYFTDAIIYGVDIFDKKHLEEERIKTIICDQGVRENWHKSLDVPLDVVVDDGSHKSEDIMISLATLFPYLKSGGTYVIEDLWIQRTLSADIHFRNANDRREVKFEDSALAVLERFYKSGELSSIFLTEEETKYIKINCANIEVTTIDGNDYSLLIKLTKK